MPEKSKLKREESRITIFKNGEVAFTNLFSELIDVAFEVNPEDKRILDRKTLKRKRDKKHDSQKSTRD